MNCDLTISIVSYNTRDLLRRCLAALERVARQDEVSVQIIVVDNNSCDDSMAMVTAEFPQVKKLALSENLGYGRANNRAFSIAHGRYFLILNSDTEVEPGSLKNFVAFLDDHPHVGAAGARLISPDGSTQISWAREPGLLWAFCEQLFLDRLPPVRQAIFGSTRPGAHDEERDVEQVCGAALAVRRDVFEQLGGFDPAYFMYYEDTDLCVRLRRAGHKIFYLPQVRIKHLLGGSSQSWDIRAQMVSAYNQSRHYYFSRHNGHVVGLIFKAIVLSGALLRLGLWCGAALTRPRSSALGKIKLFRQVLRCTAKMSASRDAAMEKHP